MDTPISQQTREIYWRENRRLMLILGCFWFVVSLGCGVLWVEPLNQIQMGGFKLGFWFAQQGAIYGFILLTFNSSFTLLKSSNLLCALTS